MTVARDSAEWVRRFHPAEHPRTRLVCFPHAGGSASYFFPVSRALAPSVEVICLQYPGRQDRRSEPCLETVAGFADGASAALRQWTELPLVLFGHSLGATIAFETARRLQADGLDVAGLFASGRRGPTTERDERVHERTDDGLLTELRQLSGTDGAVLGDHELVRMILPALRADYRAAETYRHVPGEKLRCPITALVGADDPKVTLDEARDWAAHTTDTFELKMFPGGHFYLQDHQQAVLDVLSAYLDGLT
ncbi:surfactin synthase thioesterase subunit [Tamaricihabitans halophyticus]|uniref:Surfactin synthase thioesterase subunit n=1 Tax=Tamaricihabitans halophyticus TaxID=1262583 RepID=A0A4R2Q7W6_9PSEU|nr:alpha/beta fold hydrolase [Tamaricihabitans halophyticus]TCP45023.1 surfactin synthase thioesterase subunit [Tamaricihabitans halophyticus]